MPTTDPRADLRAAMDRVNRARRWDKDDGADDWASDALDLADAARRLLAALDTPTPPHPHAWSVTWQLDVDPGEVHTAEEAARYARAHQRPGTSAVVFEVTAPDGTRTEVDLGAGPDSTEAIDGTCPTCGQDVPSDLEADPPSCGCGGAHWTCPGPDRCDHPTTSTYLRDGDRFEEECADCGEVVLVATLAEIEAAQPGFTAASVQVGSDVIALLPRGPRA